MTERARRRLRPEVRKQQILDVAVELFHEVGFEAASLRDLAGRVGINKATLYHYFESKEEILFHVAKRAGQELVAGVREAVERGGTPAVVLRNMILFQLGHMDSHTEQVKVLVEEKRSLKADLHKEIQRHEAEIFRLYKQVLAEGMASGAVRPVHLATAAFAILGQINWLYHWYKSDGPLSIRELGEQMVTILFHGLLESRPLEPAGGSP